MLQWHSLDKERTQNVLKAVGSMSDPALLSAEHSDGRYARLSFYKNFSLYRLVNYISMPSYFFDYIGDGHTFFHLNGSTDPILAANKKAPLMLRPDNILDYLYFYFQYTHHEDGDVRLILDLHEHPALDSLPQDTLQPIIKKLAETQTSCHREKEAYNIETILDIGGSLVTASIRVNAEGKVTITNQHLLLTPEIDHGSESAPSVLDKG